MAKEGAIILGSLLFVFGFLGYIVPIGQFGSVTDVDMLCSSTFGQLGQAFNEQARENCQMVSGLSKVAYSMMGIGVILAIIGAVLPSRKSSMFICGICDLAFSSEAELYNHNNSQDHQEKASQVSNVIKEKENLKEKTPKIKWKNSPVLRGVLVGIVLVMVFWGIFALSFSQVFTMSNNALSPDVNKGDLMYYERIPFNEIQEGDIIAFVPSDGSEFSSKVGIVRNVLLNHVETSSNTNPNNLDSVDQSEIVGKITSIVSDNGLIRLYSPPYHLLITGILLVVPPVIFKIKGKR